MRALLPYDCRSCNGRHHQYVFTCIVIIANCYLTGANIDTLFGITNKIFLFLLPSFLFFVLSPKNELFLKCLLYVFLLFVHPSVVVVRLAIRDHIVLASF